VVDVDADTGGFNTWYDLLDIHGQANTLESLTGGGGQHIFFAAPSEKLRTRAKTFGPGLDTRAEGGFVVLPPSVHESGGSYEWVNRVAPTEVPDWLLERWPRADEGTSTRHPSSQPKDSKPSKDSAYSLLNGPIPEGQRNDSLTRLAGWLRLYHPPAVVEALLLVINDGRCQPPLPPAEVAGIVKSVFKYPQPGVNGQPKAVVANFYRQELADG
jgi:hypothetical protein